MLLLAIDTSTTAITAAVHDGQRVLAEHSELDARRHAELLAPAVETVLQQAGASVADLTDVAVGVGPGPFTGLRVGIVTARVLADVGAAALHGVCSLDALAQQVCTMDDVPPRLLVATDARRREVYWATYDLSGPVPVREADAAVSAAADLPDDVRALPAVGRGAELYPEALTAGPWELLDVSAGALATYAAAALSSSRHGALLMPDTTPLYLRAPDATPPSAPKRVTL